METKKLQLPALLVLLMILTNFNLATAQTVIFQDDFESGNLDNWTIIDSDGDSKKWEIYQPIDGANSGSYAAVSWSWDEEIGGLNPDDWMISPQVAGAKFMKFFIQSGTGKTDNYAIYASTTGNDISDFSVVYEAYL
ncbi:MAG TPA: choice-of-anchor J domain-containing protein, partial [Paludibacteraceae bacterium]|nr:choice-of-anchor J domain-containing protein [Paludibacteraceae bacterium]